MNVSAVLVTRGDVLLQPILKSLPPEWEVVIWNNGLRRVAVPPQGSLNVYDDKWMKPIDDLVVYGRYAAIKHASGDLIYVQDDDCVLKNPANVVAAYEQGMVSCNIPYAFRDGSVDSVMVGFGACFHRDAPARAFRKFWRPIPPSDLPWDYGWRPHPHDAQSTDPFLRACDVVFTTLTPTKIIHEPLELLDYSYADNRMWRQPGHNEERRRIQEIATEVMTSQAASR